LWKSDLYSKRYTMIHPETSNASALVTGASSGIGAEFARQLAAMGYQPILVARRENRLVSMAESLENQFAVRPQVLAEDLSTGEGIERVVSLIASIDNLEILVNNAGFGVGIPFSSCDIDLVQQMISVHVTAPVRFCRAALPGMISRGCGTLINVSSIAAFYPLARNATYAASKAYLVAFSRSLHQEFARTGIRVQALCPGFVVSEFHDTPVLRETFDRRKIPRWLWMKPGEVVGASLRALERKQVLVVPGAFYRLVVSVSPFVPYRLLGMVYR